MENELYHYGVKGMKWGVRRYQNKDGTLTAAGRKRRSQDVAKLADKNERTARKQDLKNRRTMSDAQLKKKIERLELEAKYKRLSEQDLAAGRSCVRDILKTSGKKVATAAAAGALAYGVKVALTREFDLKEAAQYIATNPNKKK